MDSDRSGQILASWIAKEELRKLLALARTDPPREVIAAQLYLFYNWCAATTIGELHTLATTVETWWPEIEAFIDTGITNAKTEGLNRLVKQVKRSGCGFRKVDNKHRRVRFTALGPTEQQQRHQDHCPLKFEEPSYPPPLGRNFISLPL
jgi:hypothetical protein